MFSCLSFSFQESISSFTVPIFTFSFLFCFQSSFIHLFSPFASSTFTESTIIYHIHNLCWPLVLPVSRPQPFPDYFFIYFDFQSFLHESIFTFPLLHQEICYLIRTQSSLDTFCNSFYVHNLSQTSFYLIYFLLHVCLESTFPLLSLQGIYYRVTFTFSSIRFPQLIPFFPIRFSQLILSPDYFQDIFFLSYFVPHPSCVSPP